MRSLRVLAPYLASHFTAPASARKYKDLAGPSRYITGFFMLVGPGTSVSAHKSAALHRARRAMQTSENPVLAKFAEFLFHALG